MGKDSRNATGAFGLLGAVHERSFLDIKFMRDRGVVFRKGKIVKWNPSLDKSMRMTEGQSALSDVLVAFRDDAPLFKINWERAMKATFKEGEI